MSAAADALSPLGAAGTGLHSAAVPEPGGWQCHEEAGVERALQLLGDRPRIIGKFRQFCEGTNMTPEKVGVI